MRSRFTRRIPLAVGVALALAVLALAFPASASPGAPNPGHAWTELENHGTTGGGDYWLGPTTNNALELDVNGARALRLEPPSTSPNVIGGYYENAVIDGARGATIGGGGEATAYNRVSDHRGTVGGGEANIAGDADGNANNAENATVGGGGGNTASGPSSTVGGGNRNSASGINATIGGGLGNEASAYAATVSGGGETAPGDPDTRNRATDDYSTVGGGGANQAGDAADTNDNAWYNTVGGGQNNVASGRKNPSNPDYGHATVGGGYGNLATGAVSTIGGGLDNEARDGRATVGGGAYNLATDYGCTVAGGNINRAGDLSSETQAVYNTVGGGELNIASGMGGSAPDCIGHATVGGGYSNEATATYATIGGGYDNGASVSYTTVGGGRSNHASGEYATIPGGWNNSATGDYSLAAGRHATAAGQGCFVWGDSSDTEIYCENSDAFMVQAGGGVYLYSSSDQSTWCYLAPGGNSWSCSSDRNLKENFQSVDAQEVLAALAEVPITTWNMKGQDDSIHHMGPVAQDFYQAFGLGESDTSIGTADADGVALAAIQGLYQLSQDQGARIQALEDENGSLQQRLDSLEARVSTLEAGTGTGAAVSTASSSGVPALWPLLGGGLALVLVGLVLGRRLVGGRR